MDFVALAFRMISISSNILSIFGFLLFFLIFGLLAFWFVGFWAYCLAIRLLSFWLLGFLASQLVCSRALSPFVTLFVFNWGRGLAPHPPAMTLFSFIGPSFAQHSQATEDAQPPTRNHSALDELRAKPQMLHAWIWMGGCMF